MKKPIFKKKSFKMLVTIIVTAGLSILSSRVATKDEQINKSVKDVINQAGVVLIDLLTSNDTVQNKTADISVLIMSNK